MQFREQGFGLIYYFYQMGTTLLSILSEIISKAGEENI
jgi:hypothetical protein